MSLPCRSTPTLAPAHATACPPADVPKADIDSLFNTWDSGGEGSLSYHELKKILGSGGGGESKSAAAGLKKAAGATAAAKRMAAAAKGGR